MAEDILRRVDTDWLLLLYGATLTDKQRELAELHFREDLSLAEIAQQEGVSRQCVHETLQRVEKQLRAMEDKLGLRARMEGARKEMEQALDALRALQTDETARIQARLERAISLLTGEEDTHGL